MTTKSFRYAAFVYDQRETQNAPRFCLFHAKVSEILQWAAIQRLSKNDPVAVQRDPKRARILGIKRFLDREPRNTIPTSVVLTLDSISIKPANVIIPDGTVETEKEAVQDSGLMILQIDLPIGITDPDKPGLVIDGQHRLKGIEAYNSLTHVNVVALLDADVDEKAFQFLVINNKVAKISADHIRALNLNYTSALTDRLKDARLSLKDNVGSVGVMDTDPDSPFCGLIKWPNNINYVGEKANNDGYIVPAAIESSIGYIKSLGIGDLDDNESVDEFFITIWRKVSEEWKTLFNNNKGNKLLDKVSIVCLTEFLVNELRYLSLNKYTKFSMADPDKVAEFTKDLLDCLHPDFWTSEWKSTSYDTRAGRDQIVASLKRIYGNMSEGKPWNEEVDVIALKAIKSKTMSNRLRWVRP